MFLILSQPIRSRYVSYLESAHKESLCFLSGVSQYGVAMFLIWSQSIRSRYVSYLESAHKESLCFLSGVSP